jgi:hypothetical protein
MMLLVVFEKKERIFRLSTIVNMAAAAAAAAEMKSLL